MCDLTRGPEAVRLDARRVRAAVAGGGVPGQALVVRHASRAAAAGSAAFVQVVHVQLQSVADVRLPVLLLLCGSATHRRSSVEFTLIPVSAELFLPSYSRDERTERGKVGTFVFLQATDLFEDRLQVHVEPMAVAEQLQEVTRTNGTARVVDEFAGRGQTIGEDFKLLPLEERKKTNMVIAELRDLQPPVMENMLQ